MMQGPSQTLRQMDIGRGDDQMVSVFVDRDDALQWMLGMNPIGKISSAAKHFFPVGEGEITAHRHDSGGQPVLGPVAGRTELLARVHGRRCHLPATLQAHQAAGGAPAGGPGSGFGLIGVVARIDHQLQSSTRGESHRTLAWLLSLHALFPHASCQGVNTTCVPVSPADLVQTPSQKPDQKPDQAWSGRKVASTVPTRPGHAGPVQQGWTEDADAMTLRTICIHLSQDPRLAVRLEWAATLAKAQGAQLIGIFRREAFPVPAHVAEDLIRTITGRHERTQQTLIEQAREQLGQAAARHSLAQPALHVVDGHRVGAMAAWAMLSDALVLAQTDPRSGTVAVDFPDQLLRASGRPAIVIPYTGSFPSAARRILVAWKPSPQSARALQAALPLLAQAESVEVVSFSETDSAGSVLGGRIASLRAPSVTDGAPTPESVIGYLRAYGIEARLTEHRVHGGDVGQLLLSHAADRRSDLLVMGAYSRIRWVERVLGGVTRTLLESMTLPVLMSR